MLCIVPLAAKQDAPTFGLVLMLAAELVITSFLVSPDEALRTDPRCLWLQWPTMTTSVLIPMMMELAWVAMLIFCLT